MSIKKELQAFYAKQGLQGKHLRKAIQWDMKAVSAEVKRKQKGWAGPGFKGNTLMDLHWGSMPKVRRMPHYWTNRYMGHA